MAAINAVRLLTRTLPALLFPQGNACHLCGRALRPLGEPTLCEACARELALLRLAPSKAVRTIGDALPCATAYEYGGQARALDLLLKFGNDRYAAPPLAEGMASAYADAMDLHRADLVVPVPLHKSREQSRGYNQAELLASAFCECTGLAMDASALRRVRKTAPQSNKTREERLRAMSGAFKATDAVRGKRVLLVDDVLTTGATLLACADALIDAGAWDVLALTASRA